MLYREICKILGFYLLFLCVVLLLPLGIAAYYEYVVLQADHPQPHSTAAFAYTLLITLALSGLFSLIGRHSTTALYRREGLAVVVFVWLLTPAIASLPFLFSGTLKRFDQAYFEVVSGFTTTGSSILQAKNYDPKTGEEIPFVYKYSGIENKTYEFYGNIEPIRDPVTHKILFKGVEAVGTALLFWRSFTLWLGGVGIVILFVALLPALGVGGKVLFQAESMGPVKEGDTPRIKQKASRLWKIYIGITLAQTILLMVTNRELPWLDAVTIAFGTVATGGFSVRNDSIASYHNGSTELIVFIFMIMGSINFYLYYYLFKGKFIRFFDPEFIVFMLSILGFGLLSSWYLIGVPKMSIDGHLTGQVYSWWEALRYGGFQAVSAHTTTGFVTANYDNWPSVIQMLMLVSMYIGAMSGSTGGGIKVIRHYMLFRIVQHKIELIFRPQAVRTFRIGNKEIDSNVAMTALCFFVVIIAVTTLGVFLYIMDGIDAETALGVMASSVNNGGMGFRAAGVGHSLAFMSPFSTYCSILWMILGRLEFFAVLVMLVPAFWKQNS